MPRAARAVAAAVLLCAAATAVAGPTEEERARNAVRVLGDIQAIPESAIPDKLLDEARGIVVVPDTLKIGLVIGGRRGHGLMSVKNPDGTWSQPSFVKLTGGSVGFQAGVQSADVVLVFRSERGLDSIVNGKVTLGADAGVAAGPVGRNAATATDGQLKAEIWSWSRARGLFAGIALDGAVLSIDDDANQAVYGPGTTPRMIFEGRAQGQPANAVVDFRDQLEEATALARARRDDGAPAARPAASTLPATTVPPPATTAPMTAVPADPAATTPQPPPFETVEEPVQAEPLP
ncbi:lipid-binding SYLF domain-containing protein [Marilutibacter chinensis]|uniref:lipid-binding SYLF domain-containing protein n=1 Tax=Marilutibacter chinensis TaxID=2912247 RepID=UPI003CCD64A2